MAFDIDKYAADSRPVKWDDLDLDQFIENPLPARTLRSLTLMAHIEVNTACYTRDLLLADTYRDPTVTTFLTTWNREEFWHGEALFDLLSKHGIVIDYDAVKSARLKLGWKDYLAPIKQGMLLKTPLAGKSFPSIHMAWGMSNELSAIAAYHRMSEVEENPTLTEMLSRIARQESRHVAFYTSQARDRLADDKRAQKVARYVLNNFWAPVGSTIMSRADMVHLMGHLMSGTEGRKAAAKVDKSISNVPGLHGLTIVQNALDKLGISATDPVTV